MIIIVIILILILKLHFARCKKMGGFTHIHIYICMQRIPNVCPRLTGTCNHCIVVGNAKHKCGELTGHGFVQASGLKA